MSLLLAWKWIWFAILIVISQNRKLDIDHPGMGRNECVLVNPHELNQISKSKHLQVCAQEQTTVYNWLKLWFCPCFWCIQCHTGQRNLLNSKSCTVQIIFVYKWKGRLVSSEWFSPKKEWFLGSTDCSMIRLLRRHVLSLHWMCNKALFSLVMRTGTLRFLESILQRYAKNDKCMMVLH